MSACSSQRRILRGDSCNNLAFNSGLTVSEFVALNPGINCFSLQIGSAVCLRSLTLLTERPSFFPSSTVSDVITSQTTTSSFLIASTSVSTSAFTSISQVSPISTKQTTESSLFTSKAEATNILAVATNISNNDFFTMDTPEKKRALTIVALISGILIFLCIRRKKKKNIKKFNEKVKEIEKNPLDQKIAMPLQNDSKTIELNKSKSPIENTTQIKKISKESNVALNETDKSKVLMEKKKYISEQTEISFNSTIFSDDKALENDVFYNLYQNKKETSTDSEKVFTKILEDQRNSDISTNSSLIMDYAIKHDSIYSDMSSKRLSTVKKGQLYTNSTLKRDISAKLTRNATIQRQENAHSRLNDQFAKDLDSQSSPNETVLTQEELKLLHALN
ncbi:hypothetical protein HK099_007164 [Clydaea vesicula]|uniref:LysM domain-containing protein n=1 Tax=Clydaea vesicula TaxID=447962 RepID=A0AAD5TX19_9FUNG|nr:hypothetical protein HK099_007164 [Clydaea vesicula]